MEKESYDTKNVQYTAEGWGAKRFKSFADGRIDLNGANYPESFIGVIYSPVFTDGCNAIHFYYTQMYENAGMPYGFIVEIIQNGEVKWSQSVQKTITTETVGIWNEFSYENLDIEGEFQVIITNACLNNAQMTYPADVVSIKDLCLTKYGEAVEPPAPDAPAIDIAGNIHPEGGFWNEATVTLSSTEAGAGIYYTTDNTAPTDASTAYAAPFKLTETTRLKAVAVVNNLSSTVLDTLITVTAVPENMVQVSVTMNSASRTMTLTPKGSNTPIAAGNPTASYVYSFLAEKGDYVLTGYNAANEPTGTMELTVDDEQQIFKITTVSAYASNAGWVLGTDYELDCRAQSREGEFRVITPTVGTVTAGRKTFLMQIGDTYILDYTTSAEHVAEGLLPTFNYANTVTAATSNAGTAIPAGRVYSLIAPQGASIYVGGKRGAIQQASGGTHYVAFTEMPCDSVRSEGEKQRWYYTLGNNCTYNYRVSQPGKLTNAGKFRLTADIAPLEVTQAMLDVAASTYINHNTADNTAANVADILMNINGYGHLKMKSGATHQLIHLRSWQLTDNSTNNYFLEPDYHYTVVDVNGNPSDAVVEIGDDRILRAKGQGTAIVQVTYDAIDVRQYDGTSTETSPSYYYGNLWSAIWPENTGTFVVTVDELEDTGISRNMNIQEEVREDGKNIGIDTEHDVLYYPASQNGYVYTFKPEGVATVAVARPTLETNISRYTGFENVAKNADDSYTLLLTFGRNIIRLTSASGASEYQVISAKPVTYEVKNVSNPAEQIQPGDEVLVQFNGFYHPANKLAGLYNMSAYITYNGTPNGTSLILSPNQYQFAGTPSAQAVKVTIPSDWDTSQPFELTKGALQVNGYGSMIGKHRSISPIGGINPNFTAVVHVDYFGSIPDVSIPVHDMKYFDFSFTGFPRGTQLSIKDSKGTSITSDNLGIYTRSFGNYAYEATCAGYRPLRGVVSISSQSPESQTIALTLTPLAENDWDGVSQTQPEQVTAEESNTAGGAFEGMEGFYKIARGSDLAWFATTVNGGNGTISAIVTDDIQLSGFDWTKIGNNNANNSYKGTFDGGGHTVSGLYINVTTTYEGLFGFINAATVKNLTVEGSVKSTANNAYVGGLIAFSSNGSVIENCHNKATVSGTTYVGGILGYSNNATLRIVNCTNSGDITASNNSVGGILGHILNGTTAVISEVSNSGTISASGDNVGGIVGTSVDAQIRNAVNTGDVRSSGTRVGGISGNMTAVGSITNAYNAGVTPRYAIAPSGVLSNVYALGEDYTDAAVKSAAEFASGEVAWLLGAAFGQTVGVDALPQLGGAAVYKVTYTNNLDSETADVYTNGALPEPAREGYTSVWKTAEDGVELTEVDGDAILYLHFTPEITNGPDRPASEGIRVYPNPFTDYLVVETTESGTAQLFDLSGKPVLTSRLTSGSNCIVTSALPKGSYLLKFGVRVVKVIN
jgi:hypothetical protein